MPNEIKVGDSVKIKKGNPGEGFLFTVSKILPGHFGETQVYGNDGTYGPVRLTEIEHAAPMPSAESLSYAGGHVEFARWLDKANAECLSKSGLLGIFDLPDQCWRDMFDDEVDIEEAVNTLLEESGFPVNDE